MMRLIVGGRDFTSLCVGLEIVGNIYACSDTLSASVVFENHDGYLPPVFVSLGENVKCDLEEDGNISTIFQGEITEVSVKGREGIFTFIAREKSHLLSKNDVYGLFSSRREVSCKKAIEQAGLTAGALPSGGGKGFYSYGGMTAKAVIDRFYGEDFYIDYDGKVNVRKVGERVGALNSGCIFDIKSAVSLEKMVNHVSLTNSKHHVIYNTQSNSDIVNYGKYRKYYQISGNTDAAEFARGKLAGITDRAVLTCKGDFSVGKGMALDFDLPRYGLAGRYVVTGVTHRIAAGVALSEIEVRK